MSANANDAGISGVLAGLATSDMDRSIAWLSKVIGSPESARPMEGLADWYLGSAGTLQLTLDPERAGGSMVTFHVTDIAATKRRLAAPGIDLEYDETTSDKVKFGSLQDPDGNSLTFVEAKPEFSPQG